MHNPAENDVLIGGAADKVIEHMGNIVHHHAFCLVCYLKGAGVLAPVTVQKYAVEQLFFQILEDGGFANPHCTAN